MRWTGHAAGMGIKKNAYKNLVGKPKGKTPFGRSRRRWEDNIKKDVKEIRYEVMEWFFLTHANTWL
jgi:hypothetical protein